TRREHDRVVVFQREAVEDDGTLRLRVEAVEEARASGQVRPGEGERRGERGGREEPPHWRGLEAEREGGEEALTHLEEEFAGVDEPGAEERLDLSRRGVELGLAVAPDGEVETGVEEPFR